MATLQALRCLVAVSEAGSMTTAASELHLSQPALSHQMAALERELGTALFERLPRGVRPTAAARAMLDDARLAVAAAGRAEQSARAVAAGSAGHLRIGVAESMTVPVLAPVLGVWRAAHPKVRISLVERSSADGLIDGLARGELDLVLSPQPGAFHGCQVVLGEEEILVAMSADDPLAGRRRDPSLKEIASRPVVHYDSSNGLRGWLDREAGRRGVALNAAVETRQATSAAQLAAAGLGVALVPASALHGPFTGCLRSLAPRLTRTVVASYFDDRDVLLASFRADLVEGGVPRIRSGVDGARPGVPAPVSAGTAGDV